MLFVASENSILEAEIRTLQRKLMRRDSEIRRRGIEVHKLRVRFLFLCQDILLFAECITRSQEHRGRRIFE